MALVPPNSSLPATAPRHQFCTAAPRQQLLAAASHQQLVIKSFAQQLTHFKPTAPHLLLFYINSFSPQLYPEQHLLKNKSITASLPQLPYMQQLYQLYNNSSSTTAPQEDSPQLHNNSSTTKALPKVIVLCVSPDARVTCIASSGLGGILPPGGGLPREFSLGRALLKATLSPC